MSSRIFSRQPCKALQAPQVLKSMMRLTQCLLIELANANRICRILQPTFECESQIGSDSWPKVASTVTKHFPPLFDNYNTSPHTRCLFHLSSSRRLRGRHMHACSASVGIVMSTKLHVCMSIYTKII